LEAKQELRKAHFSFGSQTPIPDLYTTTNRAVHNLNPKDLVGREPSQVKVEKAPTNVVYGNDQVVYSSVTKETMVEHNVKGQMQTQ
jgi:hypothetical protein